MSSPQTPRHSRNTSIAEFHSPLTRMDSRSSFNDTTTPLRRSFNLNDTMDSSIFASGSHTGAAGLGNLADELAGAFSDDEDDEDDEQHGENGTPSIKLGASNTAQPPDSGIDLASLNHRYKNPPQDCPGKANLHLPEATRRAHKRAGSEYDGSEYGSDSDFDSANMSPSLVAKMDAVESLVRRGTEANGGPADGVFGRVTEGLRDLGSQAGVEGGATRLITAYAALTSHVTNQTRQLQNLSYPLFAPMASPPHPDTIEELLPVLTALSKTMPRPSTQAFNSLAALHSVTNDLVQTLTYLSDTLHMSRQTTNIATRRLKSAREAVAEMRREDEAGEEAEKFLANGNWGERLQKRECASVCKDVVGGFEEVCNSWRQRLLAQAESTAA